MQAWFSFRTGPLSALPLAALLGLLTPTSAAAEPEDLPQLPADAEDAPAGQPSADPDGPSLPPYMVEEPFTPPEASDDAELPPQVHGGPPPGYVFEPPPPPPPAPHRAPKTSLWLGGRLGMIAPFGKLDYDHADGFSGPNWADVAGPGSSFELDAGGRFERHFVVYAFWERGSLGIGRSRNLLGEGIEQTRARTDLYGVGFRWTSNPDETGLVLDAALGHRRFRADFGDDVRLRLSSPIEVRIGIGADIRVSRVFTISPMMQISNGSFMTMHLGQTGQPTQSLLQYEAPHGTFGLAVGGHFDLAAGW